MDRSDVVSLLRHRLTILGMVQDVFATNVPFRPPQYLHSNSVCQSVLVINIVESIRDFVNAHIDSA